jgi:TolB protein
VRRAVLFLCGVLMAAWPAAAQAAFPGQNGRIAFASDRDGDFEIYTVNPDGSGLAQVTRNAHDDRDPAWSPDGTRIAFTSVRDGNSDVYVIGADGQGEQRVTVPPAVDADPAWDPAGGRLVFTRHGSRGPNLYLADLASGAILKLPGTDLWARASWHPRGDRLIALTAAGASELALPSGRDRLVSESHEGSFDRPSYSPEGRRVIADWGMAPRPERTSAGWVLHANGKDTYHGLLIEDIRYAGIAWAPAGDRVVHSLRGDLAMANPDGTATAPLTSGAGDDIHPDWAPAPGSNPPKAGPCRNPLSGSVRAETLRGSPAGDRIRGGLGHDVISGGDGDDCLVGELGDDRLKGGSGVDELIGGKHRDSFSGGAGDDLIEARDRVRERVVCGTGDDTAVVDHDERVATDCERVERGVRP